MNGSLFTRITRFLLVLSCLVGLPFSLLAHPHVFIDSSLSFVGTGHNPEHLRIEWRFDEIFSASVFADFPKPKSGIYEGKQLAKLKDGYFDNLKDYGYFTRLFVEGKSIPVRLVSDFAARVEGASVVYGFTIAIDPDLLKSKLVVCFFDQSFFVAFNKMELQQVRLDNVDPSWQLRLVEVLLNSQGWGPIKADEMRLNKDGKP